MDLLHHLWPAIACLVPPDQIQVTLTWVDTVPACMPARVPVKTPVLEMGLSAFRWRLVNVDLPRPELLRTLLRWAAMFGVPQVFEFARHWQINMHPVYVGNYMAWAAGGAKFKIRPKVRRTRVCPGIFGRVAGR